MLVYPYKQIHVITSALDKVFKYSPLLPTPRGHYLLFTTLRFDPLLTPPQPARRHVNTVCCERRGKAQTNIGDGLFLVQSRVACHRWRRRHGAFFNHGGVTLTTVSCRLFELQEQRSSPSEKPPSWHVTLERRLLACGWRGTSQQLWHRRPALLYPDSPTIKSWHFPLETIWIIYDSLPVPLVPLSFFCCFVVFLFLVSPPASP